MLLPVIVSLLALSAPVPEPPEVPASCGVRLAGDPAHALALEEEQLPRDWLLQVGRTTLLELVLAELHAHPNLLVLSGGSGRAPFNFQINAKVQRVALDLVDDRVELRIFLVGSINLGGLRSPLDGFIRVSMAPAIETIAGAPSLVFRGPQVDPSGLNLPPLLRSGAFAGVVAAAIDGFTSQLQLAIAIPLSGLVGFDRSTLATTPGLVDPFASAELAVVATPDDGRDGFINIGGMLAAAPPCDADGYPLFWTSPLADHRKRLAPSDISLAFSARLLDLFRARIEAEVTAAANHKLDELYGPNAFYDVNLRDFHLRYRGLRTRTEPACACASGDAARVLALGEAPSLEFHAFLSISVNYEIFGWEPGPITLQIDGQAWVYSHPDRGMYMLADPYRANIYGPWWADAFAYFLEKATGIDIQDAATFEAFGPQPFPVMVSNQTSPYGAIRLCGVEHRRASLVARWGFDWMSNDVPYSTGCGPDRDGDHLADASEIASDSTRADTDGDGLSDGIEIRLLTNPNLADTDGDGSSDWIEVIRTQTDPLHSDTDRDGAVDGCEGALSLDPLRRDTDADGIPDGRENIVQTGCVGRNTGLCAGQPPAPDQCDGLDPLTCHAASFEPSCAVSMPAGSICGYGHTVNHPSPTCMNRVIDPGAPNGNCPAGWTFETFCDIGGPAGFHFFACILDQTTPLASVPEGWVCNLGHSQNELETSCAGYASRWVPNRGDADLLTPLMCPPGFEYTRYGDWGESRDSSFYACVARNPELAHAQLRDIPRGSICGLSHTCRAANACDGHVVDIHDPMSCPPNYELKVFGDRGGSSSTAQYACVRI